MLNETQHFDREKNDEQELIDEIAHFIEEYLKILNVEPNTPALDRSIDKYQALSNVSDWYWSISGATIKRAPQVIPKRVLAFQKVFLTWNANYDKPDGKHLLLYPHDVLPLYTQLVRNNEIETNAPILAKEVLLHRTRTHELPLRKMYEGPTVGFEFEYDNYTRRILSVMRSFLTAIHYLLDLTPEEQISWRIPDSTETNPVKLLLQQYKNEGKSVQETILELQHLVQSFRQKLEYFFKNLRISKDVNDGNVDEMFIERDSKLTATGLFDWMRTHTTHTSSFSNQLEISCEPSFSLSSQFELMDFFKEQGAIPNELYPHQTISGVELTSTQNDFMETAAILKGAGLLNEKEVIDLETDLYFIIDAYEQGRGLTEVEIQTQILQYLSGNKLGIHPKISEYLETILNLHGQQSNPKVSYFSNTGTRIYFPWFFRKENNDKDIVKENISPLNGNNILTEIRVYAPVDFNSPVQAIHFVQGSRFFWFASWGESAKQGKMPTIPFRENCIVAWNVCLTEWSEILRKKGIFQPPNHLRGVKMGPGEIPSRERKVSYPFERYLTTLMLYSEVEDRMRRQGTFQGKSLKQESRRIMREYQAKLTPFIGP